MKLPESTRQDLIDQMTSQEDTIEFPAQMNPIIGGKTCAKFVNGDLFDPNGEKIYNVKEASDLELLLITFAANCTGAIEEVQHINKAEEELNKIFEAEEV